VSKDFVLLLLLHCRTKNESYGVDLIQKLVSRSDGRVRPGVFGKQYSYIIAELMYTVAVGSRIFICYRLLAIATIVLTCHFRLSQFPLTRTATLN